MTEIQFTKCKCCVVPGKFDIENIPLDCEATWKLISGGHTVGVFQIEKKLGQDWARKVKPDNMEELAALVSLLRPGPLYSEMSQRYVDIKSGKKEMEFLHPSLKPILEVTQGQMVYQEQALKIAVEIAGFNPEEADSLRKSIGKKDVKLMAELKHKFISGAKKKGLVEPQIAEEIFSWIEECQRYQFNKSHAVSYAMVGYKTAWMKCHFPHEFFTSWLTYSHYKSNPKEEIYGLVQDARLFNVPILSPDIRRCNIHFKIVETPTKSVAFGLAHIRSVGQSAIKKIVDSASGSLDTWHDFLTSVPNFHRNVGIALIKAGACDCYGLSRSQMIHELEVILGATIINDEGNKKEIKGLTKREREWLFEQCSDTKNMADILSEMSQDPQDKPLRLSQMKKPQLVGLGCSLSETMPEKAPDEISKLTKPKLIDLIMGYGYQDPSSKTISITEKRRAILAEKAVLIDKQLEDTNTSKAMAEKHFLGIALSCSPADDAETDLATHTCLDVARAMNEESITVCAIVDRVTHTKTKRGKNPGQSMCFLTISDSTYSTDAVVFPQAYAKNKGFCHKDSIVLIYGKKQNRSFIVSEIQKLI